jgi:hypothetical protein
VPASAACEFDAAAGSLRFEIAASVFLDRKIIQETRFRALRHDRDLRSGGRNSGSGVLDEPSKGGQRPRSIGARLHGGVNVKDSGEGRLSPNETAAG